MAKSKPTMRTASWAMTHFRDTAVELLTEDKDAEHLRLYFYAVSMLGWQQLAAAVKCWRNGKNGRRVTAYIGTDHALTDPKALTKMQDGGVEVFLLRHYRGVFHPKVIWFSASKGGQLLAGSNNLTEDGLTNNIEFATLTQFARPDDQLQKWHDSIHVASELLDPTLLESYRKEKEKFGQARAKAKQAGSFTWSKRTSGDHQAAAPVVIGGLGRIVTGDLVLEVMPRETSVEGSQVQIPLLAASRVFGLGRSVGDRVNITLTNTTTTEERSLTLTRNRNSTSRLSIRELEYRSRPCVLLFRKTSVRSYSFELVRRAIDPGRYADLLSRCPQKRPRRWAIQ